MAHYGVLFLDELPEFNKSTLELLRQPIEDSKITINRLRMSVTYPCRFMFVASMNPCPCGYYASNKRKCNCTKGQIKKYMNKISGPLLDRIDIQIEAQSVKYEKLKSNKKSDNSKVIKSRVNKARNIQLERYKKYNIFSNAELTPELIEKYCSLNKQCEQVMKSSFEKLNFSTRAYHKILKVARTIADLEESKNIEINHLTEAIQYRSLDRKYWEE